MNYIEEMVATGQSGEADPDEGRKKTSGIRFI